MADSQARKKKGFWTIRNVIDLVAILGFILALILASSIAISPLFFPVRAKLTIFIDHTQFSYTSESNSCGFTVFLKIVNDSPKSANIFSWDFSLIITVPYQILSQTASRNPPLVLISSAEADLNLAKTLIGENDTAFPSTSVIKSISVTVQYEDDIGAQEASRSYDFPSS